MLRQRFPMKGLCHAIQGSTYELLWRSRKWQRTPLSQLRRGLARSRVRDATVAVLEGMTSMEDIHRCKKILAATAIERFALLLLEGERDTDFMRDLCACLRRLYNLQLLPVILHCKQQSWTHGGDVERVVEEASKSSCKGFYRTFGISLLNQNAAMVSRLDSWGIKARPLTSGILLMETKAGKSCPDQNLLKVDTIRIKSALSRGYVPIITCMAETQTGEIMSVSGAAALATLARTLGSQNIIYLSEMNFLLKETTFNGPIFIDMDNTQDEETRLSTSKVSANSTLADIKILLNDLPKSSRVCVVHPKNLLPALLATDPASALLQHGPRIHQRTFELSSADTSVLRSVLQRKHGIVLSFPLQYDDSAVLSSDITTYHDDEMDALVAVVPTTSHGVVAMLYQAVIAFKQAAWLSGSAYKSMYRLRRQFKNLVWKVQADEDSVAKFEQWADGSFKYNQEILFWYGIDSPEVLQEILDCSMRSSTPI